MNFVTTLSAELNTLKQRVVKVLRFGKGDVQTALEASAYGQDSNPIKGMVAIYAPTTDKGATTIIGYINKNQKAEPGEFRTFATNTDGVEKFYIWMKATGIVEIGGDGNWAVKFNELKTEFNKLKDDYNAHIAEYNLHLHSGGTIMGATGVPAAPSTNINTSNIDNAKNDKIKTI